LDTATTYYALAYVKNSIGNIFYSDEISFTTKGSDDFSSLLNGEKKDYYPNGKLMREYFLKNGSINGILKMYSDSGYVVSEQNYTNGLANGPLKVFNRNGNIKGETTWINGESGGQTKEYFENGSLKLESNCSGDLQKLSCQIKTYYENGQLKSEIISSNGVPVQSMTYDQHGRVGCKETPGKSICYRYDEDGTVHVIINGVEQK
jgi:antitoxin component YwqK of YwqJK toxin-antitoxin module